MPMIKWMLSGGSLVAPGIYEMQSNVYATDAADVLVLILACGGVVPRRDSLVDVDMSWRDVLPEERWAQIDLLDASWLRMRGQPPGWADQYSWPVHGMFLRTPELHK